MTLINQAARCAENFLSPLGKRWLHVQGVAQRAHQISKALDPDDATYLVAAAYLHDIGYAPALKRTGFHPLDGASYLRSWGDDRLASLVAYHSEAYVEARLRGLEHALKAFSREYSVVADALTYCDQTIGPTGKIVSLDERVTEVFHRYGEADIVAQALRQALPSLTLTVERMRSWLHFHGLEEGVN